MPRVMITDDLPVKVSFHCSRIVIKQCATDLSPADQLSEFVTTTYFYSFIANNNIFYPYCLSLSCFVSLFNQKNKEFKRDRYRYNESNLQRTYLKPKRCHNCRQESITLALI